MHYYWGKDPSFVFGSSTPFGMNARQHAAWLYEGGGGELIDEFLADRKVFALPAGNTGGQMAGWFRKEIHAAGDFQGLKMRIGGFAGKVFQTLGAEPVAMPKDGIYPALESGALDAMEWVGPYDDEKFGERKEGDELNLSKVAPYYYYPGWWKGGMQLHLIVDREKFDALPKAYQAAFRAAAAVANASVQAKYDAANPGALKRLVVGGARIAAVSAGRDRGLLQDRQRSLRAARRRQSEIQEDRRFLHGVPRRPISLVAGRRIFLRQFHDPAAARQELSERSHGGRRA